MNRLFVGLAIPEIVADALGQLQFGLDCARWRTDEHFHITLCYIGSVDQHGLNGAAAALGEIDLPAFSLTLKGCDFFGGDKPNAVWAGVEPDEALMHLQRKIDNRLRREGFELERRKYTPHVTLAYLTKAAQGLEVAQYCAQHNLFACGPFPIREFHLYRSFTGGNTSHYEILASYPLLSAALPSGPVSM